MASFVDNRPGTIAQRELAEAIASSPRAAAQRAFSEGIHNSPRMVAQRQQTKGHATVHPTASRSGLSSYAVAHPVVQRRVPAGLSKGTPVRLGEQNVTVESEDEKGYVVVFNNNGTQHATYAELEPHPIRTREDGKIVGYRGLDKDEDAERDPVFGPGPKGSGVSIKDLSSEDNRRDGGSRERLLKVFLASIVADRSIYGRCIGVVHEMLRMIDQPQWEMILVHAGAYFIDNDTRIRFYKEKSIKVDTPHPPEGLWEEWRQSVLIAGAAATSPTVLAKTLLHELTHLVIGSGFQNKKSLPFQPDLPEEARRTKAKLQGIWDEWQEAVTAIDQVALESAVKSSVKATISSLLVYPRVAETRKENVYEAFNGEVFSHFSEVCYLLQIANADPNALSAIFKKTIALFRKVPKAAEKQTRTLASLEDLGLSITHILSKTELPGRS